MPQFEFVQPNTVQEALKLIKENDGFEAILWGGGTASTLLMKQKLIAPDKIIDLKKIKELHGIRLADDGSIEIGAATHLRELEKSDVLKEHLPVVAETASLIGNVRVRNAATLAGHLVHADPAQDLPPLMLVLNAQIYVASEDGERTLPIDDFFIDIMETAVEPNEIITKVVIPKESLAVSSRYVKFAPRSADDYGTVGVAASVKFASDHKTVDNVRIAVGGAGATAMLFPEAAEVLQGQSISKELAAKAADIVAESVEPWDDGRGTEEYKRAMSRVWTERVLLSLAP